MSVAVLVPAASAQAPLLHYPFTEASAPPTTENIGTFMPGPSPLIGYALASTSNNGTPCLVGVTGPANEVTTPFHVNFANNSWTVGFALNSSSLPQFQYLLSEDLTTGWRVFTDGVAGAGNIRMTGGSVPTVDIAGGAGESGWVHVAWVHDTVANQIRAYLNGTLVSTTAAPAVNLNSGMPLIIGRLGTSGLVYGNRVEEFRLYDYPLTTAQVAAWSASALTKPAVDFTNIKLSEVTWGDPDGVEITNFSPAAINLTNWKVRWRDSAGIKTSDPLNVSIAAGESIVVMESLPIEPVPAGTQVLDRFSAGIGTASSAITVALCDEAGNDVDEVRISDTAGAHPGWSFGTWFRGLAMRGAISGTGGQVGVERIWGLDSNGGTDWTEQPNRSLGRENRSSGPRGTDVYITAGIKINEIDDNPDYIELYNSGPGFDLGNWFIWCSSGQGVGHTVLTIPPGTTLFPGGYLVLGDSATPPAELPAGVAYVNVGAIPWTTGELDCALYDNIGLLEDLVRVPRAGSTLVHNLPRAPSYWSDFVGAAGRNLNGGSDAIGRGPASTDTNSGGDWFPIYTRTMGSANVASSQAGPAGHDDHLDVRLNETSLGQGFQAIINAGVAPVGGSTYNFLVSVGHSLGTGPFFGLGGDALANLPLFYNVPPFSGPLDAQGSARIEFNPGSLPPGLDADFIFVLQLPGGAVSALTYVLAFDT